jgi:sterol desaturase/sphingolipid hydroxylase (fatty acid hydroxylase superfamily)
MYYWDHRAAHRNRAYWALAHSVHHSSPQFDQTTGLRVSFVDGFVSPWFYVPVVLAGFDPLLVGGCLAVIIGWQQWLHTEAIDRLPWLDPWLNTPSNHRVHHGVQARYQDVNYGAILMLWDRAFGTYVAESPREPRRYGITHPIASTHPLEVHLAEARRLWRDLAATPDWRTRLARLWHAPDWRPEHPG